MVRPAGRRRPRTRRRFVRRRTNRNRRRLGRPSRPLMPSRYFFTRHTQYVRESIAAPSSGQWVTNLAGTEASWYQSFQLNQLNDYTDYTALFNQYRINAVKVTLISQNTEVVYPQFQCMVYVVPNPLGRYSTSDNLTEEIALDTQAVKVRRWVTGKPLTLFTRVNQLSAVYNAPTSDYVKIRPRMISTDEVDTPHYGMSLLFVNQNGAGLPAIPVKIITKYYLEFRGSS